MDLRSLTSRTPRRTTTPRVVRSRLLARSKSVNTPACGMSQVSDIVCGIGEISEVIWCKR